MKKIDIDTFFCPEWQHYYGICHEMIDHINAYRDTGLTPEQIIDLKNNATLNGAYIGIETHKRELEAARKGHLRRWEFSDTPPDGWYWYISPTQTLIKKIQRGTPWTLVGYVVYGPIPEPEVTDGA